MLFFPYAGFIHRESRGSVLPYEGAYIRCTYILGEKMVRCKRDTGGNASRAPDLLLKRTDAEMYPQGESRTLQRLAFFVILSITFLLEFSSCHHPTPPEDNHPITYYWTVDTLHFTYPGPAPGQVNIQCIWGSSVHDVWATGTSDDVAGELWHYDGKIWQSVSDWPFSGIDSGGSFINDVLAVTGFDSTHVFVFGYHGYDTTGQDIVLKWDGHTWTNLPWAIGSNRRGGLGWGVKQNNDKLWAVSSTGQVVKYDMGLLSIDTVIPGFRLGSNQIASLDNGQVCVNAVKDSVSGDSLYGTITQLYFKSISGGWVLAENKFISGAYEDGNGLGIGVLSIHNRLFTINRGLWERVGSSWVQRLQFDNYGGSCFYSDSNAWIYFNHSVWEYDSGKWTTLSIPALSQYQGFYLYGTGWSNGSEVFLSLTENGSQSFILHRRVKGN